MLQAKHLIKMQNSHLNKNWFLLEIIRLSLKFAIANNQEKLTDITNRKRKIQDAYDYGDFLA